LYCYIWICWVGGLDILRFPLYYNYYFQLMWL
jgi:hypothetical protein